MKHLVRLLLVVSVAGQLHAEDPAGIARRIFDEILSKGEFERAAELYAPGFVNHGRLRDAGLAEDQAAARGWKAAVPDMVLTPELIVTEGDLVAVLWRGRGTNSGSGNGIPPTGRRVNGRGITVWRVKNGRVQEEWSEFSSLTLLQQIGLAPGGEPVPTGGGPMPHSYPPAKTGLSETQREQNRTAAIRAVTGSLSSLRLTVHQTIAEGDLVACIYTSEGKRRNISIFRIDDDGQVAERWDAVEPSEAFADEKKPEDRAS